MRRMPGYERFQILRRAADLMHQRQQDLGRTISLEEGKILGEGVLEAARATETIELSAEEAKRIDGETLPLDGAAPAAWANSVLACGFHAASSRRSPPSTFRSTWSRTRQGRRSRPETR